MSHHGTNKDLNSLLSRQKLQFLRDKWRNDIPLIPFPKSVPQGAALTTNAEWRYPLNPCNPFRPSLPQGPGDWHKEKRKASLFPSRSLRDCGYRFLDYTFLLLVLLIFTKIILTLGKDQDARGLNSKQRSFCVTCKKVFLGERTVRH